MLYSMKYYTLAIFIVSCCLSSPVPNEKDSATNHSVSKRSIVKEILEDFPNSGCKNSEKWQSLSGDTETDECVKCVVEVQGFNIAVNHLAAHVVRCREKCQSTEEFAEFKNCIFDVIKVEDPAHDSTWNVWVKKPQHQ